MTLALLLSMVARKDAAANPLWCNGLRVSEKIADSLVLVIFAKPVFR